MNVALLTWTVVTGGVHRPIPVGLQQTLCTSESHESMQRPKDVIAAEAGSG